MNKKTEFYSLISGVIFLISGIAKSLDIFEFQNTIVAYGYSDLHFFAPFIVMIEVLIGLLLIFHIQLKHTALIAALLTTIFTLVFIYGLIFKGIENCGCFGGITFLNSSPTFTIIRNVTLIYLLISVWRKASNEVKIGIWILALILISSCAIGFISGYHYRKVVQNKNIKLHINRAIRDSALKDFITISKDSTYMIFVFTYSCFHCMNSIENLKQYESSGFVDKVIALALEDSINKHFFLDFFKPNFSIKDYPSKDIFRLTRTFPLSFLVKNDSIIAELSGELPSSYILQKEKP